MGDAAGVDAGRSGSAFRAPCPSVTSRRGHSPCRWPTSRRVTATAPAKSHAHDPVAGARKGTPMTVLAIGDARCSWPASRNTRGRAAVKLRKLRDQADTPEAQRDRPGR